MKTYLLVFDDGADPNVDLGGLVNSLDDGAQMYGLDGHVCFLKSRLSVQDISERFLQFAGSSLYFIADVSAADYSGRMPGIFWDFLNRQKVLSAAE